MLRLIGRFKFDGANSPRLWEILICENYAILVHAVTVVTMPESKLRTALAASQSYMYILNMKPNGHRKLPNAVLDASYQKIKVFG